MSITSLARPEIQALHAYNAAEQVDDTVRLNANESPATSAAGNFRRPLNRYPEVRPQGLQATLAHRFGCASDQLLVTRGSSEAIDLIIRTFCRAEVDSILTPSPSFSMYRHYAELQAANIIEVATLRERDFAIDIDAMLQPAMDLRKSFLSARPTIRRERLCSVPICYNCWQPGPTNRLSWLMKPIPNSVSSPPQLIFLRNTPTCWCCGRSQRLWHSLARDAGPSLAQQT